MAKNGHLTAHRPLVRTHPWLHLDTVGLGNVVSQAAISQGDGKGASILSGQLTITAITSTEGPGKGLGVGIWAATSRRMGMKKKKKAVRRRWQMPTLAA